MVYRIGVLVGNAAQCTVHPDNLLTLLYILAVVDLVDGWVAAANDATSAAPV